MKKYFVLLFIAVQAAGICSAQQAKKCGTTENLQYLISQDPGVADRMEQMEAQILKFSESSSEFKTNAIITIPVVFHVVYKISAQNVSDSQLQSQLTVLNKDFIRANADTVNTPAPWKSIGGNMQLQFCLAKRDPWGNATTGITRTLTTAASFTTDNKVKSAATGGHDAWDRDKYLNIWVCNIGGGKILGYAQFPNMAAETDGVVIHYRAIGTNGQALAPNDKGRTCTHEVGHWLGLRHTWGDDQGDCTGSDQVSDTPNSGAENYNCPTYPLTDNCTTTSPGVMFMNYMDYCEDNCTNLFTAGQVARAYAASFNSSRAAIKTSNGCVPVGIEELRAPYIFSASPNPSNGMFSVDLRFNTAKDISLSVYNMIGKKILVQKHPKFSSGLLELDLAGQPEGIYFMQVEAEGEVFTKRISIRR